jgi:hypothetical protein
METKELDCLLVEGKDVDGLLLKFTLRGESPKALIDKLTEVKTLLFPDFVPAKPSVQIYNAPTPYTASQMTPSQALGDCRKCGAPNKISKAGKVYCSATCWLKK